MSSIEILENYISAQTNTDFFGSQKNLYKTSTPSDDEIRANQDYKILVIKTYRNLAKKKWTEDKESFDRLEGAGYKRTNDTVFQPGAQLQILAKLTDNDITSKSDSELNKYINNLAIDSEKDFNAINKKPFNQAVSSVSNLKTKSSSIISFVKGLSGAVLAPIGFGLVVAESGIRTGLTCLYCIGYGILEITEKFESTSLLRKAFGNNEFKIRGAKEHTLSAITSLVENNYTIRAIDSSFFSDRSQKSTQNKENSHGNDALIKEPGVSNRTKSSSLNYKSPNHKARSSRHDPKQDSGSAQRHPKRTKSAEGSSYFDAHRSGDRSKIAAVEDARFEREKKFQERQEAERKKREETKQKAEQQGKTRPLPRASTFPSQSPGQIHNPLMDSRTGRLKKASTIQGSPLSRPKTQQPRRNGGVPGSNPGKPLNAKQAISMGVDTGAPPPRHR